MQQWEPPGWREGVLNLVFLLTFFLLLTSFPMIDVLGKASFLKRWCSCYTDPYRATSSLLIHTWFEIVSLILWHHFCRYTGSIAWPVQAFKKHRMSLQGVWPSTHTWGVLLQTPWPAECIMPWNGSKLRTNYTQGNIPHTVKSHNTTLWVFEGKGWNTTGIKLKS